jgi:hypothetical protein
MRKRVRSFIRSWRLRRRFLVMFIPYLPYGDSDAVAALAPRIRRKIKHRHLHTQLDEFVDSFRSVARQSKLELPSRVVLFAHPCPSHTGFAVNSATSAETLRADWWRYPGARYEFIVAHVCRGAEVLRRASYREVFPEWISYREDIEVYTGSPAADERWVQLTDGIIRAAWESESFTSATLRLQAVYTNALAQVYDTKRAEDGDSLTLIHFMGALEALTTSAD